MLIPNWGLEGQKKLKAAKVLVAGVGGLGCPAAIYLTAAGVGELVLIDKERFDLNNLNRQILGWRKDLGSPKAMVAKNKLEAMNPEVRVYPKIAEITKHNVHELIGDVDVVVDGQDNWKTRFIINKYCVENKIPFVHAGVSEFHGQMTTIAPETGPCLKCIFPKRPPEKVVIPVLGATPALLASLQVMDTLKIITGFGKPLIGQILFVDGKEMNFERVDVKKMPECPVCGYT
jgi:adenylyltransferase/sulfurtransferase